MAKITWFTSEINRRAGLRGMTKAAIGRHLASDLKVPEGTVKGWIENRFDPKGALGVRSVSESLDRLERVQVDTVSRSPLSQSKIFREKRTF